MTTQNKNTIRKEILNDIVTSKNNILYTI